MRLPSSWSLMILFALTPASTLAGGEQGKDKAEPKKPAVKITTPYLTAHDAPLDVKESIVKEEETFTQYRVEFNGIKGDRVPSYLYVPKNQPKSKAPYPAILLQYGSGGNKNTNYIVLIGKEFVKRGFVVLTIDSPGQGERRVKDKKSNILDEVLNDSAKKLHYCADYSRAVDMLAARPEVDKERLCFLGISYGAITGIVYVAHDPRIKAMASMVGGGNFLGNVTTEAAQKAAKEVSKSADPIYHVARIAPLPLLFLNVTKDQLIFRPWSESLHKAAPDAKVVWVETDHYFKGVDQVKLTQQVIDFLEEGLATKRPEIKDGKK
jgi:dienelactone hydrolase